MNKKRGLFVLFFVSVISLIGIVSAYGTYDFLRIKEGSQTLINFIIDWAEPFIVAILGGNDYTGEILFTKVLLFVLFFSFIWLSLSRVSIFSGQKPVKIIICLIVPILSLRYVDSVWLSTIITNYQILGIAVTSIIPFIIFFFFINNIFADNSALRKMGWILFIVIYFGLYVTNNVDTYSEVYFWTGIIGFVFLLMDGTMQRVLLKQQFKESANELIRKQIAQLDEDIKLMQNSSLPQRTKEKSLDKLLRNRAKLMKSMR